MRMNGRRLARREFLALGAAAALLPRSLRAEAGVRVATLDWALLETLLAIGANVVAATELLQFREVAVKPEIPAGVADLGLRGTPNFEALRLAAPDLIVNSNFYQWANERMSRIAPVETHSVYVSGQSPYALSESAALALGQRLKLDNAARFVDGARAELERLRQRLGGGDGRAVMPINLGDARHFRAFGADSIFGDVLARLGLENAWKDATSYSANAPVGIEALAAAPDAWIVLIPPHPLDALRRLEQSAFWNALPAVAGGRVLTLGSVNPYGAVPAALRFANLLVEGMLNARNG